MLCNVFQWAKHTIGIVLLVSGSSAYASWQLVWSDEFNGTSLDRQKWACDTTGDAYGWGH